MLADHPHIAQLFGLYNQCRDLGVLPEDGGLLDQSGEHVAYFNIFSAAEPRE